MERIEPDRERVDYLLKVHTSHIATDDEEEEFLDWILKADENLELRDLMLELWNQYNPLDEVGASPVNWDEMFTRLMNSAFSENKSRVRKFDFVKLILAASLIIGVSVLAWFYLSSSGKDQSLISELERKQMDFAPPSVNKATLVLGDGTVLEIGANNNGIIADQGNIKIIKSSEDEILYQENSGSGKTGLSYNTLNVPKGSKPIKLTLSDGSRVWLNVGSGLTYPTVFGSKGRTVKVWGEAYFEIAHMAENPFEVQHDDLKIKVLGTHFNVKTYEDEKDEQITLLEGSVELSRKKINRMLKPGQQALIDNQEPDIKILKDVNTDGVIAWREGKFVFDDNMDIGAIMRQISRWYNVEVEYEGQSNLRFWGTISKDVSLSQVLHILEATGGVRFKMEKNKVIVMPAST